MNKESILAYFEEEKLSLTDGQKAKLTELEEQLNYWKNEAETLQKQQTETQLALLAEEEMLRFGVSNPRVVWALLNPEKIQLKEGEVLGLSEQLQALKAAEDTAFLFKSSRPQPKFVPVGRTNRHRENAARSVMGLKN